MAEAVMRERSDSVEDVVYITWFNSLLELQI
jgi:hypothetical protein